MAAPSMPHVSATLVASVVQPDGSLRQTLIVTNNGDAPVTISTVAVTRRSSDG